tara:strand:- start:20019 stop:20423 length:405 start_codon:yes stop_codon:yes gene_type:complete
MISVTRKSHFNAAHRLHNDDWSEEKNAEFYGLCNNKNYHGHNYDLEVTVTGEIDKESGYLIDMKYLSGIIEKKVCDRFDHKNLNLDTEEFKNLIPTAENIAVVIWNILRDEINPDFSISVKLYETQRNIVEYSG